jgi:ABC-type dipeptide/oligopeptide/nickel transport system ATPase subunit
MLTPPASLSVRGLKKRFAAKARPVLDGIDLDIRAGETLALLGKSGSGKTTLARCLVGLEQPESGSILVNGRIHNSANRIQRLAVQMVWQDPVASLSPFCTAGASIMEPLSSVGAGSQQERGERVDELLRFVGLNESFASRLPFELSGGECQRIGVARALAANPSVLVLDEPFSALDPPMQAEIVPLLKAAIQFRSMATLLVSHDLTAVRQLADRVAFLADGRIVENKATAEFLDSPEHPIAQQFVNAWRSLPFP